MNASAVNNLAAIAAALKDIEEKGSASSKRGSLILKSAASSRGIESSKYGRSTSDGYPLDGFAGNNESANEEAIAMDDEEFMVEDDFLPNKTVTIGSKARARRASEGSYLTKGEGKRSSGELRCDKCGKGYKHSSCLTKHLSVYLVFPSSSCLLARFDLSPLCICVSRCVILFPAPISNSSFVNIWCLQMGAYS